MTRSMMWLVAFALRVASASLFVGLLYMLLFDPDASEMAKWKMRAWAFGTGLWSYWVDDLKNRMAE